MTPRRKQLAGTSLLETIVALFVLTGAALVVVALFHSSLRRTTQVQAGATARMVAQSALAEARRAAASVPPGSLTPQVVEQTYNDPDHPTYLVDVRARMHGLANPCSTLHDAMPIQEQQVLTSSVALVEVLVTWNNGRESFSLVSLLEEGETEIAEVVVTGGSGSLAALSSTTLTAQARDASGVVIPDVNFVWWVEPITGNALIFPDETNGTASLKNETRGFDGVTFVQAGTCRVGAQARYRGKEVIGYSNEITLSP